MLKKNERVISRSLGFSLKTFFPTLAMLGTVVTHQLSATPEQDTVPLADGGAAARLWLQNEHLKVGVIPTLGGKIVSLQNAAGREFLSRSEKPYSTRIPAGRPFGEMEFDGADELFPTLGACTLETEDWGGITLPGHGEVVHLPWSVIAHNATNLTLEVSSPRLPYVLQRQASLVEDTLLLSYSVTNRSEKPLPYFYAFHPLFVGSDKLRYDIADDQTIVASWSMHSFLGQRGTVRRWDELKDAAGQPFKDAVFIENTGRYYKFFSTRLEEGRFRMIYADGTTLELTWPADKLPHYAIWCSEGNVDGLHHVGIEPTTCIEESLSEALAAGTVRTVPPSGRDAWWIRIRLSDGQ